MGEIYLVIPVLYEIEISFVGDVGIVVEENYLGVRNVPVVQSVFVGNRQTPFALEDVTSGRDLTFMEIAAPAQAFAPGIGGLYLDGSWFLTGESRPYDRAAGVFARLRPRRDLSLRRGGLGAVELGARYSHVDLNDGPVRGGIMDLGTIGLNWYWNPYVKMKFNDIVGGVRGSSQDGNLHILQARFELDF